MNIEKKQLEKHFNVVEKRIKHLKLINLPATLMIGLGGYAKFASQPETLHPLLGEPNLVNAVLAIAIPWATVCTFKLIKRTSEMIEIKKQLKL
jgi:hypothetical protein